MSEDDIRLQPATEQDVAIIEELVETPAGGEFTWFGFPVPGRQRKRWAEHGLLDPEHSILMVVRTGSRPTPNWRTSPSSVRWRRQASPGRACSGPVCGATERGGTASSTASCGPIRVPRDKKHLPSEIKRCQPATGPVTVFW